MKKKIIILALFIVFLISIFIGYSNYKSYNKISELGLSFSYPKEFMIDKDDMNNNWYTNYIIENQKVPGFNRSTITIYIPKKNEESKRTLADYTEPRFHELIKPITINGHEGEAVTYYLNEQKPGDRLVQAEITHIYLASDYANTPVAITYYRYDADHSLDKAWKIFLKTLRY